MLTLRELQAAVGWDTDDEQKLLVIREHLEPSLPDIAARFFTRLSEQPALSHLFGDDDGQERMRRSLHSYVRSALGGIKSDADISIRNQMGAMHASRGAPPELIACAFGALRRELQASLGAALPPDLVEGARACLDKAFDLEVAALTQGMHGVEHRPAASDIAPLADLDDTVIARLPLSVFLLDGSDRVVSHALIDPRLAVHGEALVGQRLQDALLPELVQASQLPARLERARTGSRELLLPRVDVTTESEARSYRLTVVPLPETDGHLLVHVEDLTDAIQGEARALRTAFQQQLGTMVTTMAHEVRNPLAGISGTIQVISASLDDGDSRAPILDKVQDEIRRLSELMQDLLRFTTKVAPTLATVDLVENAREAVSALEANSDSAVSVLLEGEGAGLVDAGLLLQVLGNLLGNARDAGASRIELTVSPGRIRVDDDGPGIPGDMRAQVFEPFFTTQTRGTGLGLPVARKFVELMGGSLELCPEAKLGGTSFVLSVPNA